MANKWDSWVNKFSREVGQTLSWYAAERVVEDRRKTTVGIKYKLAGEVGSSRHQSIWKRRYGVKRFVLVLEKTESYGHVAQLERGSCLPPISTEITS